MSELQDTLDAIRQLHDNDYDEGRWSWGGDPYDNAQQTAGRLLAAVESVLELHRKEPLYSHEDDCTSTDENHTDRHIEADDGEFYCHDLIEDWTCSECADVQDVASLGDRPAWPCTTVRTLTDKLTGEGS